MPKFIKEAPANLMLSRTAIQTFPNGQKVALYFCNQLKKYFSLNYGKSGIELSESSVIEYLKGINNVETIEFVDGTTLNIDNTCSNHIIALYEDISEGQEEFEQYIIQSDQNFLKLLDYSIKNIGK